ncbi:nuclear poly(A) polymerase 3-like isoform X2 [Papaver somniferum]|uniref:nuclear poly(A) polymerase 3-like isoform X2 n=1 Tax=Papaver somniferum TaxID=3469 RepID=UPI000E6F4A7D|nr:nuclear poly(A) polymerase 3-like isoform X2 [Papaver somniferum]
MTGSLSIFHTHNLKSCQCLIILQNMDVLNPFILENIDETSWKCLSGVRANMQILQLVPNLEKFQLVLRCLKLWARRLRSILQRMGNFHFL